MRFGWRIYKPLKVTRSERIHMTNLIFIQITALESYLSIFNVSDRGGRGRAGTVGSCLLQSAYGLSADEALLRVQVGFG